MNRNARDAPGQLCTAVGRRHHPLRATKHAQTSAKRPRVRTAGKTTHVQRRQHTQDTTELELLHHRAYTIEHFASTLRLAPIANDHRSQTASTQKSISMCASSWSSSSRWRFVSLALSVLASTVICASTDAEPIEYTCSHSDEYFYAVPGSRCRSYYRCAANGTRTTVECSRGATFDFFRQICTRSAGICYEPVCTGRTDGLYQDTTHACRRSMRCQSGRLQALDNCPAGQLHDGLDGCRPTEQVICSLPQSTAVAYPYAADRRCRGRPAGRHASGAPDDCRGYLVCGADGATLDDAECAPGWRFDAPSEECVRDTNGCSNGNETAWQDDAVCQGRPDGDRADPMASDGCRSFVRCERGRLLHRQRCAGGTLFNGSECVPNVLYDCPTADPVYPKRDVCKHKADGVWSDARLGCRAYVRCERGISAQPLSCPAGEFFDPERRVCASNASGEGCRTSRSGNECAQLQSGFYADKSEGSSCRRYFHCYNGNRTDFRCSDGRLFDGERCVDAAGYVCPNRNEDSCESKPDGYYRDVHASCRAYYLCTQGRKLRFACGAEERFDGAACVRRKPGDRCQDMGACAGRSDGYHADRQTGCRNYYYCLNAEVLTTLTCRGGRLYDGRGCVAPEEYECPAARPADDSRAHGFVAASAMADESKRIGCVRRPKGDAMQCQVGRNGFFADVRSGCREYYFCIGPVASGVLRCAEGFVFNGELCVRSDRYDCPRFCEVDD